MYDIEETNASQKELQNLVQSCKTNNVKIAVIGGWASRLHVNDVYKQSFGKNYMGSRDIDVFFKRQDDEKFLKIISDMGFFRDVYPFRWRKIYDKNRKTFITEEESKNKNLFDLIQIFLDVFSDGKSERIDTWCDLGPLKNPNVVTVGEYDLIDVPTLVDLKCIAMASRERADKENKDACDLYALLEYSNGVKIPKTTNLESAIKRILTRPDLLFNISTFVLLDVGQQSLVISSLRKKLDDLSSHGFIQTSKL